MSGLPCDACQEPTPVIQTFEPTLDGNGELVKLRWRVCTNPNCEKYMVRRVSVEYYPEQQGEPYIYQPRQVKRILRAMGVNAGAPLGDLPLLPWGEDEQPDN